MPKGTKRKSDDIDNTTVIPSYTPYITNEEHSKSNSNEAILDTVIWKESPGSQRTVSHISKDNIDEGLSKLQNLKKKLYAIAPNPSDPVSPPPVAFSLGNEDAFYLGSQTDDMNEIVSAAFKSPNEKNKSKIQQQQTPTNVQSTVISPIQSKPIQKQESFNKTTNYLQSSIVKTKTINNNNNNNNNIPSYNPLKKVDTNRMNKQVKNNSINKTPISKYQQQQQQQPQKQQQNITTPSPPPPPILSKSASLQLIKPLKPNTVINSSNISKSNSNSMTSIDLDDEDIDWAVIDLIESSQNSTSNSCSNPPTTTTTTNNNNNNENNGKVRHFSMINEMKQIPSNTHNTSTSTSTVNTVSSPPRKTMRLNSNNPISPSKTLPIKYNNKPNQLKQTSSLPPSKSISNNNNNIKPINHSLIVNTINKGINKIHSPIINTSILTTTPINIQQQQQHSRNNNSFIIPPTTTMPSSTLYSSSTFISKSPINFPNNDKDENEDDSLLFDERYVNWDEIENMEQLSQSQQQQQQHNNNNNNVMVFPVEVEYNNNINLQQTPIDLDQIKRKDLNYYIDNKNNQYNVPTDSKLWTNTSTPLTSVLINKNNNNKEKDKEIFIIKYMQLKIINIKETDKPLKGLILETLHLVTNQNIVVLLTDIWMNYKPSKNTIINIIQDYANPPIYYSNIDIVVSNTQHWLIINPMRFISCTTISTSFSCIRKTVLDDYFSTNIQTKAMIYGSIKHDLFEYAITNHITDDNELMIFITNIIPRYYDNMIQANMTIEDINSLKYITNCVKNYIQTYTTTNGGPLPFNNKIYNLKIEDIISTEDQIFSPIWGIKGIIDIVTRSRLNNSNNSNIIFPLELKTGKKNQYTSVSHNAQLLLYSLLLSEVYGTFPFINSLPCGSLVYLSSQVEYNEMKKLNNVKKESEGYVTEGINTMKFELKNIVNQRNILSEYSIDKCKSNDIDIEDLYKLPEMCGNNFQCSKCFNQNICMLMQYCFDKISYPVPKDCQSIYNNYIENIPLNTIKYLNKWLELLFYELIDSHHSSYYDIKTTKSSEREKIGKCIGRLIYNHSEVKSCTSFLIHFKHNPKYTFPLTSNGLDVSDYIVLSIEDKRICLLKGYIYNIDIESNEIVIESDSTINSIITSNTMIEYRIDSINNSVINYTRSLHNIFTLLIPHQNNNNNEIVEKERENHRVQLCNIIIDGQYKLTPLLNENESLSFPWNKSPYRDNKYIELIQELKSEFFNFNIDQRKAIQEVFNDKNKFTLIQGMPGTGKTTVLAFIIKCYYCIGYNILIMSYTNLAVDNILQKIVDSVELMRIGNNINIFPSLQKYSNDTLKNKLSYADYLNNYNNCRIIGTTCLNITNPLLQNRIFDLCIIDESSQIIEPLTIGPLLVSKRFVLVGDHYQLPPLVISDRSKEKGMSISLFERLLNIYPKCLNKLSIQYRMNKDIMKLSNYLIYNNELKCIDSDVNNRLFVIPKPEYLSINNNNNNWLKYILSSENSVLFINTDTLTKDGVNNLEKKEMGKGKYNNEEVSMIVLLLENLYKCSCKLSDIGIISPYLCQIEKIKDKLKQNEIGRKIIEKRLEISTVDKYQGRDKEMIILSFVRSNIEGHVGKLIKDWRRINVAITRAKSKLIIIGSEKTIVHDKLLKSFVDFVKSEGWFFSLPENCLSF